MNKYFYILLFSFVSSLISEDLVVDGQSITMSGNYNYDNVQIINGGSVLIDTSIDNEGRLTINCDSLWIDSSSSIQGNDLVLGGVGSPETGGGAGHGGYGGDSNYTNWCGGQGGVPYGEIYELTSGSSGGGGVAGLGGGAVKLKAHYADIQGTISMQGGNADVTQNQGGGTTSSGGGSGGMIFLEVNHLNIEQSYLDVRGGSGGGCTGFCTNGQTCYGGGGSGGRISIVSETEINGSSFANLSSGAGYYVDGAPAEDGDLGQYFYERTWLASLTHPNQEKSYYNTSPAFTMNAEGDIYGYFYLLNNNISATVDETSNFTSENSITFENLEEGSWYFHVVPMNTSFELLLDQQLSYQVNIITSPLNIFSNTHPDEDYSYLNSNISFDFQTFNGLSGYYYTFNQLEDDTPSDFNGTFTDLSSLFVPGISNGTWWLHLVGVDSEQNIGSNISHFKVNINVCDSIEIIDECGICSGPGAIYECGCTESDLCGVCNGNNDSCEIVTDVNGNQYGTVTIGNQVWMRQNLKVTNYSEGSNITYNDDLFPQASQGFYTNYVDSSYPNEDLNIENHGRLYNWYAVDDERGLCPEQWFVPSYDDMQEFKDYLTSEYDTFQVADMIKDAYSDWDSNPGTNETGFTAKASGKTNTFGGNYSNTLMGQYTFFWLSTSAGNDPNNTSAQFSRIWYGTDELYINESGDSKTHGFSVRCMKTVFGCTDSDACNYLETANEDDGSCDYSCFGCTDDSASNYNPDATVDDGSCINIYHINIYGSDEFGDGSEQYPYETIQKGIDSANDGDTILVANGIYYENLEISNKDLVIASVDGPSNTIIDSNYNGRGINILGLSNNLIDVEINGFTIRNGRLNDQEVGGGININSTNINSFVLIKNCIISNTSLNNSGNQSKGGGIYIASEVAVSIENCIIKNNEAYEAGGISVSNNINPVALKNTLIYNNTSYNKGGGIVIESSSSLLISNSTIYNNISDNGGGIYNRGNLEITSSILSNNQISGSGCGGTGNGYQIQNDGNNNYPANITLDYSLIEYGEEEICNDMGIINWEQGNIDEDPQFVDPDNGDYSLQFTSPCIDAGDPSGDLDPDGTIADMGAFYFDQIEFPIIEGCADPGADNYNPDVNIENPLECINNGPTYYVSPEGNDFFGIGTEQNPFMTVQKGIDIAVDGDTIMVAAGTYNYPNSLNTGISVVNKNITIESISGSEETILNCSGDCGFQEIQWGTAHRVLYVYQSTLNMNGFTISSNNPSRGGVVIHGNSTANFNEMIFDANVAQNGDEGGALTSNNSDVTILNSLFINNSTMNNRGGALNADGGEMNIDSCNFLDNNSANVGGAISINNGNNLSISNSILTNNSGIDGGAIWVNESSANILNCTISNNTANEQGGGVHIYDSYFYIQDSEINNNFAEIAGGGLYLDYWDWPYDNPIVEINSSSIINNSSNYGGGGIALNDANILLKNTLIANNSTSQRGGGVYVENNANLDIKNSTITNNVVNVSSEFEAGTNIYSWEPEIFDSDCTECNKLSILNSIIWQEVPSELVHGAGIFTNGFNVLDYISFSHILDITSTENPQFLDSESGNFTLQSTSPCIDAGDPNSELDPDGTVADMGAFYFHQTIGCTDTYASNYNSEANIDDGSCSYSNADFTINIDNESSLSMSDIRIGFSFNTNGDINNIISPQLDETFISHSDNSIQIQLGVDVQNFIPSLQDFSLYLYGDIYDYNFGNSGDTYFRDAFGNNLVYEIVDFSENENTASILVYRDSIINVPDDYNSIQSAIDNSVFGDTVMVAAGTYYENINISNKTVIILGEDKYTTILDAQGGRGIISSNIDPADFEIHNFTITNGDTDDGSALYLNALESG
ncbi:hypothetical protein OAH62_03005, partial [Candidatus Marinimicrobia bacterium]|nr:hypothetical protein [Candidatus Neomarinimicrobiota bacterium]